jgi:hypothetical protein
MGSSDVNLQQREQLALRIPQQTSNDARRALVLQMGEALVMGQFPITRLTRHLDKGVAQA